MIDDYQHFAEFVGIRLADYADGMGDMAHDTLDVIQQEWIANFGDLPEVEDI